MIKLENVSKYYYGATSAALGIRKINLSFKKGEFVAITGESGSGKSTLLNVISGNDSYEEGEIYFGESPTSHFDQDDWQQYRCDNISFIYQNYLLIDSYTVLDNVLSALMIKGCKEIDVREKAIELLKKVGLENKLKQKAAKLSSGQKQRLSIARALAKDTNIIIADEPTGNLDSINGDQIIKLLHELSKDKLVLIVTHNFEQVEKYVSRKIRLFDGEVVEDKIYKPQFDIKELTSNKVYEKSSLNYNSFRFALKNIFGQPKRVSFIMLLLIVTMSVNLILFCLFCKNIDDAHTKILSYDIFANMDNRRLVVKRFDNNILSEEDYQFLRSVKYVETVEKDEYIDMSYYYRKNSYEITKSFYYDSLREEYITDESIKFNDHSHTVRSASFFEGSLSRGRLPENRHEIVLYDNDSSILNTEVTIYLRSNSLWGQAHYLKETFEVVGILSKYTEQIYFSDDYCYELTGYQNDRKIVFNYQYRSTGDVWKSQYIEDVKIQLRTNLPENTIVIPKAFTLKVISFDQIRDLSLYSYLDGVGRFDLQQTPNFEVSDSSVFFQVSQDIYDDLFKEAANLQASVFIDDYVYSNEVIKTLLKNSYEAISPYKSATIKYDRAKVIFRLLILYFSILTILLFSFLEVVITRSLLKFKVRDYAIFKIIGASNKIISRINYFEIAIYTVFSFLFVLITFLFISQPNLNSDLMIYLYNLRKYLRFQHYLIIIVFVALLALALASSYNKFLRKQINMQTLRGE